MVADRFAFLRKSIGYFAIGLMLLAIYALSIGPVNFWVARSRDECAIVRGIYAPVIWLAENTPLQKPLEHYVKVWDGLYDSLRN